MQGQGGNRREASLGTDGGDAQDSVTVRRALDGALQNGHNGRFYIDLYYTYFMCFLKYIFKQENWQTDPGRVFQFLGPRKAQGPSPLASSPAAAGGGVRSQGPHTAAPPRSRRPRPVDTFSPETGLTRGCPARPLGPKVMPRVALPARRIGVWGPAHTIVDSCAPSPGPQTHAMF